MPELTAKSVASQLPEDTRSLIARIATDEDIDRKLPEVQAILPAKPVVDVVLADAGLAEEPPAWVLDQADSWIKEQINWQNRAMVAQSTLEKKFPFTREQALSGDIPMWMGQKWAVKLLYSWSSELRDAVLQAETYLQTI